MLSRRQRNKARVIEAYEQTRCKAILRDGHLRLCGEPATWETINYAQLAVCEKHVKEGLKNGLTLDEGDRFLGLAAGRHYRKKS